VVCTSESLTGWMVLNQAIKIKKQAKNHVVLELLVISMTHLISILIGFHICSISIEGREFL